jgi:hypothetical protein
MFGLVCFAQLITEEEPREKTNWGDGLVSPLISVLLRQMKKNRLIVDSLVTSDIELSLFNCYLKLFRCFGVRQQTLLPLYLHL